MMPDTALIAIRALVYADLLLLFGLALFGLYGVGAAKDAMRALPLRMCCHILAGAGLVLTLLQLSAMTAAMTGAPLLPPNIEHMHMVLGMGGTGTAFMIRFAALILILPLAETLRSRPVGGLRALCAGAAVAVGSLVWAGHGAMQSSGTGWAHGISDFLHLLAAGAWIGALAALLYLLLETKSVKDHARMTRLADALRGFASTGTLLVVTLLFTGVINVVSIVGWRHLGALLSSPYGLVLAAKLAVFGAMLLLAGTNRFWLVPALDRMRRSGDARSALKALRFSIAIESGCATIILVLVAILGLLAPPR